MISICPNCDENVQVPSNVKRFDSITCPVCGEPLKVTSLNPLELDYDMSEYEYEDDDEEYEYEDD